MESYVKNKTYDIIYCSPDLGHLIPAIYIGLQMIKNSKYKHKCLIYLLPIDCFDTNSFQCRLFRILNCLLIKCIRLDDGIIFKKMKIIKIIKIKPPIIILTKHIQKVFVMLFGS